MSTAFDLVAVPTKEIQLMESLPALDTMIARLRGEVTKAWTTVRTVSSIETLSGPQQDALFLVALWKNSRQPIVDLCSALEVGTQALRIVEYSQKCLADLFPAQSSGQDSFWLLAGILSRIESLGDGTTRGQLPSLSPRHLANARQNGVPLQVINALSLAYSTIAALWDGNGESTPHIGIIKSRAVLLSLWISSVQSDPVAIAAAITGVDKTTVAAWANPLAKQILGSEATMEKLIASLSSLPHFSIGEQSTISPIQPKSIKKSWLMLSKLEAQFRKVTGTSQRSALGVQTKVIDDFTYQRVVLPEITKQLYAAANTVRGFLSNGHGRYEDLPQVLESAFVLALWNACTEHQEKELIHKAIGQKLAIDRNLVTQYSQWFVRRIGLQCPNRSGLDTCIHTGLTSLGAVGHFRRDEIPTMDLRHSVLRKRVR